MPAQYIYEPWMAPPNVQQTAKCIIGKDYPMCIVDHNIIHKKNIERMKLAYESSKMSDKDSGDVVISKETKKNKPTSTNNDSNASKPKSSITDFFQTKTSPDSQPPNKKAKK